MNNGDTPIYYIIKLGSSDVYHLRDTASNRKIEITREHPDWQIVHEWYTNILNPPAMSSSYTIRDSYNHMGATE